VNFLKTNERLIIVVLVLVVGGYSYSKWLNHDAAAKEAQATAAQLAKQAAEAKEQQLEQLVQAQSQQYAQLAATLTVQNKNLIDTIITRNNSATEQQKSDAVLQPSDLANRWEAILNLKPGDVQSQASGFQVSPPAALSTVQQLELVGPLSADLNDGKKVLENKDAQIASLADLNTSLNKDVAACRTEVKASEDACKKQVDALKASARKGKFWWFLRGLGAGAAVAGLIAAHSF